MTPHMEKQKTNKQTNKQKKQDWGYGSSDRMLA
jgi:hypothetical protein